QGNTADACRNLVRHEAVEPRLRTRTADLVFGEGAQIDDADALAHEAALVADVLEVVCPAEAPAIYTLDAARREPVGSLPTITLAPDGAEAIQLVVHRARFGRTRVGTLLVREMN